MTAIAHDGCIALRTRDASDRIALRGVRVHARLAGMSQRTTVEQTFVNLEPRAVEAVYTFPLPDGAAVCGFEVVTGDRVLVGEIEEVDHAIERYDDAIAEGDAAYLLEQERPDVFTVRVGNLNPSQAATIRITYVCALDRVDKQVRVAFPTTVAPRYITTTATDPLEPAVDGDALNPPHVLAVPYGLSLTVEVDLGRELNNVFSPSHAIHVVRPVDGRGAVVTLEAGVAEMNRDVVLNLHLAREHQPAVQVERGSGPDGESFLAVTFVPEFDEAELLDPQPAEVVFLLDCSGSMHGDSIAQATLALELCLRSMSPGDTFNVCLFGSSFELMAGEPVPYSQNTLERAIRYVRAARDMGGTEIHAPLSAILKMPIRAGQARQVVLLTDGQVGNDRAIIELARKHRDHNRVFTFGIGAACSAHLVRGVARATGGAAEFITAGERIDEKVLRTFSRLASPVVSDVHVDWDGCDVQTLAELPPVFDGDVLSVFGRCPGRMPQTVTLSCNTAAGPRRWAVPVGAPEGFGGVIATMWARRTLQSLEEVNAVPRVPKAARSREQEMMVSISKRFGLLCSLTSYVTVERRTAAERNDGDPELRRVPVQIAQGWGGVEVGAPIVLTGGALAAPVHCSPRLYGGATIDKTMDRTIDRMRSSMDRALDEVEVAQRAGLAPPAPASPGRRRGLLDRAKDMLGKSKMAKSAQPPNGMVSGSYAEFAPPPPAAGSSATARESLRDRDVDRSLDRSVDRSSDKSVDLDALGDDGDDDMVGCDISSDPTMAPIAKLVHAMLAEAFRHHATDIQIAQLSDRVTSHFHIDGQWVERDRIPVRMARPLFSQMRQMSQPAGVIRLKIGGAPVDWSYAERQTPTGPMASLTLLTRTTAASAAEPATSLQGLLSLQSADGWFEWDEHVVGVGERRQQLEAAIDHWLGGLPEINVVATIAVLARLRSAHASERGLWQRAERKAVRWLAAAVNRPSADLKAWLDALAAAPAPAPPVPA